MLKLHTSNYGKHHCGHHVMYENGEQKIIIT